MSRTATPWKLTDTQQALVERWLPYAYQVARRCSRRWNFDVDEAMSAAHVEVCAAVRYHQEDGFPLEWSIRRRIHSAVVTQMRKRRPLADSDTVAAVALSHDKDDVLDGRLLWQQAQEVLNPQQFALVHEYIGEGRTLQAIASDHGVTREAVRARVERSLDVLRLSLGVPPGVVGMGGATPPNP